MERTFIKEYAAETLRRNDKIRQKNWFFEWSFSVSQCPCGEIVLLPVFPG